MTVGEGRSPLFLGVGSGEFRVGEETLVGEARQKIEQILPFLRGDYMNQLDLSLQREFRLSKQTRFQLRVDAINALNNVQWDQPNTDPTSSNFGVVTAQYNTPRWIQIQTRLTF